MAKEARKLRRGSNRQEGRTQRKGSQQPVLQKPPDLPDPFGLPQLKALGLRLGLPLLGIWGIALAIYGVSASSTLRTIALVLPAVITAVLAGILIWGIRYARKAKGVHSILRGIESEEDRRAALEKLEERTKKKKDVAAVFARAQLLMQQDPRQALGVLEGIDLKRVMAPVADEARAQRAMIHLMLGEVGQARPLADGVDLSRHQDAKTRAMLASVVAEAWARSGQAKKALDTLEVFSPEDQELEPVRPQMLRAFAYSYAHCGNVQGMRRALKKLCDQDMRLLGGFLTKKTHPLLQREAKKLVERSGQVRTKMQIIRK